MRDRLAPAQQPAKPALRTRRFTADGIPQSFRHPVGDLGLGGVLAQHFFRTAELEGRSLRCTRLAGGRLRGGLLALALVKFAVFVGVHERLGLIAMKAPGSGGLLKDGRKGLARPVELAPDRIARLAG